MKIDKRKFNDSILFISDEFDENKEIEIDIIGGKLSDRSVWITKEDVKLLIHHLINTLG